MLKKTIIILVFSILFIISFIGMMFDFFLIPYLFEIASEIFVIWLIVTSIVKNAKKKAKTETEKKDIFEQKIKKDVFKDNSEKDNEEIIINFNNKGEQVGKQQKAKKECAFCGAKNVSGAKRCDYCGNKL